MFVRYAGNGIESVTVFFVKAEAGINSGPELAAVSVVMDELKCGFYQELIFMIGAVIVDRVLGLAIAVISKFAPQPDFYIRLIIDVLVITDTDVRIGVAIGKPVGT